MPSHSRAAALDGVPTRGIPVREPWISHLLDRPTAMRRPPGARRDLPDGRKSLEIRGKDSALRGAVALIASGTGTIVAVADLVDVLGPLTLDDYRRLQPQHRVADVEALPYARTFGYVFANVRVLTVPQRYRHRSGAVTWCILDPEARAELARALAQPDGVTRLPD